MRFHFETEISTYLFKRLHRARLKRCTDKRRNGIVADFCTMIAYLRHTAIRILLNPNTQMEICVKGFFSIHCLLVFNIQNRNALENTPTY